MAFKKGDPKPPNSGRKAGTPHKKSLLVREILENHGINLIEQIVVRLPRVSALEQVRALTALLPYVYPRLASLDHKIDGQSARLMEEAQKITNMSKEELIEATQREIKRLESEK